MTFRALPKLHTEEDILARIPGFAELEPEEAAELRALVHTADAIANPKAMFCLSRVTDWAPDRIQLDGVDLACQTLAENFVGAHRVFPYVCTCGMELEEWSRPLEDPLQGYWADQIKLFYVGKAHNHLFSYLREHYRLTGHLSHINPGSLQLWPLTGQRELFSILGNATEEVGVTLTEHCLMIPSKSTSGILFESETAYDNCRLCPLENCPGRRVPYAPKKM